MDPVLKIFIYATAVAVILQMFILLSLAVSVRKTSAKLEKLTGEVHGRAMPILNTAESILNESRGKIDTVMSNLVVATGTLKTQSLTFMIYLTLFLMILTALLFLPALALGPLTQIGAGG